MRFKFFLLVLIALSWFLFGTIILLRSQKDFNNLKGFEGQIEKIGTTTIKDLFQNHSKYILYFTLKDLNTTLGIYHNSKSDYNFYLNKITVGDTVKVYFDEGGIKALEGINLHVFQLEKNGEVLLNMDNLSKRDKKVGLILYCIGLLFSILPIWVYVTKFKSKPVAVKKTLS